MVRKIRQAFLFYLFVRKHNANQRKEMDERCEQYCEKDEEVDKCLLIYQGIQGDGLWVFRLIMLDGKAQVSQQGLRLGWNSRGV